MMPETTAMVPAAKLTGEPINTWRIPAEHVSKGLTQKAALIAFDG